MTSKLQINTETASAITGYVGFYDDDLICDYVTVLLQFGIDFNELPVMVSTIFDISHNLASHIVSRVETGHRHVAVQVSCGWSRMHAKIDIGLSAFFKSIANESIMTFCAALEAL